MTACHLNLAPAVANPWRGFDDWVNNQPNMPLSQYTVVYVTITLCFAGCALASTTEPGISATARVFDGGFMVILSGK
ncbi:hypothetical protein N9Y31_08835 [Alphaproteobacteria bacterium]|nr:hypothetical protein [Alphaproteobacteria bacterium]